MEARAANFRRGTGEHTFFKVSEFCCAIAKNMLAEIDFLVKGFIPVHVFHDTGKSSFSRRSNQYARLIIARL